MSKIDLALDLVRDLRSLADSIAAVADALFVDEAHDDLPPVAEPYEGPNAPKTSVVYSLTDVRTVLARLSHEGHTKEVQDLIHKYGGERLSDIPAENYGQLLADAEVIGNAA